MDELLKLGKEVLASRRFSKPIGAELTVFLPGYVELTIKITERLKQQHGFVHGGVIGYAANNTLTFAGGSVPGPEVVTSKCKINSLGPPMGSILQEQQRIIRARHRLFAVAIYT